LRSTPTIHLFAALALLACAPARADEKLAAATFAGGCFWCMEPPFEKLDGVRDLVAGYSGGTEIDPTYEDVSSGRTRHAEAVQIHFNPSRIRYAELLDVFWRQIDPTDPGGQFVDRGRQYRTAIFVHDEQQRRLAEASKAALEASGRYEKPLVTERSTTRITTRRTRSGTSTIGTARAANSTSRRSGGASR
jgi:methionine-S-sulfoxide reductase